MLDAICVTVYSFYDCLRSSKETLREKFTIASSIVGFLKILYEKNEHQLLLAFVELLHEHNKIPFLAPPVRYIQRYLAFEVYSLIAKQDELPADMNALNSKIMGSSNEADLLKEVEGHLMRHVSWPGPPRMVVQEFQNESDRKRVELVKRYFDKLEANGRPEEDEPELQLRMTLKPRNSITDRESSRGDESFQDIYGLIKERS